MPGLVHVTNGDSAANGLASAGLGGTIVAWRDVLHEGPVPSGLDREGLRAVRAGFLAGPGGDREAIVRQIAARDAALDDAAGAEEIVLWFEHDLYDQLQLVEVLDRLAGVRRDPPRLTMVVSAQYLGTLAPDAFPSLHARRQPVTEGQLSLARRAWAAFRSPDPTALERVLADGAAALPFLTPALYRLLEQFPSSRNGLSRSEGQALRAIAAGHATPAAAFAHSAEAEEAVFLGDTTFASYLVDLGAGAHPLVRTQSGAPLREPARAEDLPAFWRLPLVLTDDGRAVLEGRADRVALCGIDRWIGGVHLTSERCWRWDETRGALAAPAGHGTR